MTTLNLTTLPLLLLLLSTLISTTPVPIPGFGVPVYGRKAVNYFRDGNMYESDGAGNYVAEFYATEIINPSYTQPNVAKDCVIWQYIDSYLVAFPLDGSGRIKLPEISMRMTGITEEEFLRLNPDVSKEGLSEGQFTYCFGNKDKGWDWKDGVVVLKTRIKTASSSHYDS